MYKQTNEYVFDRVYVSIKSLVVTYALLPGERLKVEKLAEQFDVSTTPVREVLSRLVAEELIDMVPKMGFFIKHVSETEIRDLQELNWLLLDWSLRSVGKNHIPKSMKPPGFHSKSDWSPLSPRPPSSELAKITGELFAHIATQSGNNKIIHNVRNISDRLYYLRHSEYELLAGAVEELSRLCELYHQMKFEALADVLKAYHDKRSSLLPNLIKSLKFNSRTMPGPGPK